MSLKNKTVLITGASRGIGKAIALRAARDGANITIAAKTATPHPKVSLEWSRMDIGLIHITLSAA